MRGRSGDSYYGFGDDLGILGFRGKDCGWGWVWWSAGNVDLMVSIRVWDFRKFGFGWDFWIDGIGAGFWVGR